MTVAAAEESVRPSTVWRSALFGWAVAFVRYSLDYVAQEQEAKTARRGLWEGTFTAPEIWRRKG